MPCLDVAICCHAAILSLLMHVDSMLASEDAPNTMTFGVSLSALACMLHPCTLRRVQGDPEGWTVSLQNKTNNGSVIRHTLVPHAP